MRIKSKNELIKIILCAAIVFAILVMSVTIRRSVFAKVAIMTMAVVGIILASIDDGKYLRVFRIMIVTAVACVAVVLAYVFYVKSGLAEELSDFEKLKDCIVNAGVGGYAVFVGLTVFQVVVLPLPQAVTILLGVALYGATVSFVLSVIGTVVGSIIAFALGKFFGKKLCVWMFGEEPTNKYATLLGEKGRVLFIIMLLFPAFPDDMLCMIAGITSMSYVYFITVCLLTRPVMIGLTAYLGSGVIPFSGRGIAIWTAIGCVMVLVFIISSEVKSRIEKKKFRI